MIVTPSPTPFLPGIMMMFLIKSSLTPEVTAAGYYFSSHGAFNNSCRVAECKTCSTGEYRLGCANATGGACTICTRIPNATFTSHGWFNNSCDFLCNDGYAPGPGRTCKKVSTKYTVNFVAGITLVNNNNSKQIFNMSTYIQTVSALAGCGQCGVTSSSPVLCKRCLMYYSAVTSVPIVFRRLLSSGNLVEVNTSIIIIDDKILAKNAESNLNSSILNLKLFPGTPGAVTMNKPSTVVEYIDPVLNPPDSTTSAIGRFSTKYTINFFPTITLPDNAEQTFNLTTYIHMVASLAGCGGCGDASKSPTVCKSCKVYYTVISSIPVVFRRLLTGGNIVQVNTSIVIIDDQTLAAMAESNINSSILNSRLFPGYPNSVAMNRPFAMVELIDLVQSPYTTTSAGGENTTTKYTINFVSSIKLLNNTKQTFNLTAYIHSVASLAGCGACGDASKSPTVCKTCKVYYTIISRIPVVFRRLLYSVDSDVVQVNTSIVIIDDQTQAKTAENNINPTTMNSRLRSLSNNIESVAINQLNVFQESIVSPQPPPNPGALTTTTPPPIVIPTNGDSSGIGAIIGGAVGGIAGVALIGTVVWFTTSGNKPPKPATPLKAGFQTRHRLVYRQAGNGGISSRPTSTPKFAYMLKTQHS